MTTVQAKLPRTLSAARRAAWRARVASTVRALGWTLTLAGAAAVAAIGADRFFALGWDWRAVVGIAALAGVSAGLLIGAMAPWSVLRAAGELDARLGLRDRLSSAVALAMGARADGAFVALAARDAERAAADVDVGRAVPVRFGRAWGAGAALFAAAVAMGMFVPVRAVGPRPATPEEIAARERAAASVASTIEQLEAEAQRSEDVDEATGEQLEALRELEAELAQGSGDARDALAESAAALERAADAMDREAERDRLADEALREAMNDSDPEGLSPELVDALREGDLAAARDAARELLGDADKLSDAERERLADELEALADRLERERGAETPEGDGESSGGETDEPSKQVSPDQPASQLERPNELDRLADAARESARRVREQEAPREPSATERPESNPPTGEQGKREQAEREPGRGDQQPPSGEGGEQQRPQTQPGQREQRQGEQGQGERRQGDEQGQGEPREDEGQQRPSKQQQPSEQPGEQGRSGEHQQPGEQGQPGGEQRPQPQPQPQPSSEPGSEQGREQRPTTDRDGTAPQPQPGNEQQPSAERTGEQRPQPSGEQQPSPGQGEQRPGNERPNPQPGAQGEQQPQPGEGSEREPQPGASEGSQGEQQPSAQPSPGDRVDGEPGQGQPQPGAGGRREGLDEALDDMANRSGSAQDRQQRAQDLRDRARELLGGRRDPSDQQGGRGAGERDATSMRPPMPFTPRTEPADFRPDPTEAPAGSERVVSEWYGDDGPRPDAASQREAARVVREAAGGARRALEQQAVPRKYRNLVRSVYERMERRVGEAPPADAPLGQDAPDG